MRLIFTCEEMSAQMRFFSRKTKREVKIQNMILLKHDCTFDWTISKRQASVISRSDKVKLFRGLCRVSCPARICKASQNKEAPIIVSLITSPRKHCRFPKVKQHWSGKSACVGSKWKHTECLCVLIPADGRDSVLNFSPLSLAVLVWPPFNPETLFLFVFLQLRSLRVLASLSFSFPVPLIYLSDVLSEPPVPINVYVRGDDYHKCAPSSAAAARRATFAPPSSPTLPQSPPLRATTQWSCFPRQSQQSLSVQDETKTRTLNRIICLVCTAARIVWDLKKDFA